jgi:peptide/nickel transport system substrate-binding protein
LAAIGITVDFNPIAFSTLVERLNSRNWEAIILGFGGGGVEPNNGANIWRSTGRLHIWNLGSQPGNEAEGVEVTDWEREIDQIFAAGTRELEFEQRKPLYDRFQIIAQDQLPLIGTFNPLSLTAVRNRVEGVDPRPILGTLWNLDQLAVEIQD